MKKYTILIILIVIIVILGFVFYRLKNNHVMDIENNSKYSKELNYLLNKKIEYDKLIKISYSNSGDINGNIDEISIDIDKLVLQTRFSKSSLQPIEINEYSITNDNIEYLKQMIKKYNLVAWNELSMSEEMTALDSPHILLSLVYDNSNIDGSKMKKYTIDYNSNIPEDGFKILNEFTDYLFSLKKDVNLINTYTEDY